MKLHRNQEAAHGSTVRLRLDEHGSSTLPGVQSQITEQFSDLGTGELKEGHMSDYIMSEARPNSIEDARELVKHNRYVARESMRIAEEKKVEATEQRGRRGPRSVDLYVQARSMERAHREMSIVHSKRADKIEAGIAAAQKREEVGT